MLMRFDPFRELDRLTQQSPWSSAQSRPPAVMPIDAYRRGDRFLVHFDLPGVDPQSVELTERVEPHQHLRPPFDWSCVIRSMSEYTGEKES